MANISTKTGVSTGLQKGGVLSVDTTSTFNVTDGFGYVVELDSNNEPNIYKVEWSGLSGVTATHKDSGTNSYVGVQKDGILLQQVDPFTQEQLRTIVVLGKLIHLSGNLVAVASLPVTGYQSMLRSVDLSTLAGSKNVDGNLITANGNNLKIDKSLGRVYRLGSNYTNDINSPDITNNVALTTPSFQYTYRNGSGGWSKTTSSTDIVPGKWDDGSGTLQDVPSKKWTVQPIYLYNSTNNIRLRPGQVVYKNLETATTGLIRKEWIEDPALDEAVLIGYLIVRENASRLDRENQAVFVSGPDTRSAYPRVTTDNRSINSSVTITSSEEIDPETPVVNIDAGSGSLTATLPDPAETEGYVTKIVIDGATALRVVTIATASGSIRDSVGTLVATLLFTGYSVLELYSDGTNYITI